MKGSDAKSQAKKLYDERRARAGLFSWKTERVGFIKRVRALAKKVSRLATMESDPDTVQAMMYLDVIATREEIELKFREDV